MSTATAAPMPDLTAFARVPEELTERAQWVVWRYELRDDEPTKVLHNARTGRPAKSNAPATWSTWAEALEAYAAGGWDGVGYVFAPDDGLAGMDLDDCIDDAGNIDAEARGFLDRLASYAEISPSLTGVKVWVRAVIPDGKGRKNARYEIYDRGRFFTVTGRHLDGMPYTIEDRQAELLSIRDEIFPPKPEPEPQERRSPQPSGDADDARIIDKVTAEPKWARLWSGDLSGYGSPSEADLALLGRIGFFCGWDAGRMESLFRQSGLTREKWDTRPDYRQATIDRARAGKVDAYNWNGNGQHKPATSTAAPADDDPTDNARAKLRTDIGNAARFVKRHGRDVRFCYPSGKWYTWTGQRWAVDDRGDVVRRAKDTALSIYAEAANETDDAKRAALADHATKTQKRERLTAMLELAKPDLSIVPDEMDADPNLLNVRNGTIDLRTGELRPHRREDLITKICRANYDPAATAATFHRFLARIFRTYPNLIDWLQKVFGYASTGLTSEQVLVFLYGTGANGKTTLLDAIAYALGDYGAKGDRELLAHSEGASHPTNVADLQGRRLVICSETNAGRRMDEARLKDLVGETRLKARFMRQDFFEFPATHKLFLYSNHRMQVRGQDFGFWRRMREVPFIETIADGEKDAGLPFKLQAEADGILAWLVKGAARWYAEGLECPPEVAAATNEYRAEMDSIGAFIDEACVRGEGLAATARALYAAYTKWADDSGEKPLSQTRLGTELGARGMVSGRCSVTGRKTWSGIGLRASDSATDGTI